MWNEPSDERLQRIPKVTETATTPLKDKLIYLHFFIGACHWYVAEYDPVDNLFWGFVILNNDHINSEWGYFSFDELKEIKLHGYLEVDNDLYWHMKKASEVPAIKTFDD